MESFLIGGGEEGRKLANEITMRSLYFCPNSTSGITMRSVCTQDFEL